jgi:hypothetical protein
LKETKEIRKSETKEEGKEEYIEKIITYLLLVGF